MKPEMVHQMLREHLRCSPAEAKQFLDACAQLIPKANQWFFQTTGSAIHGLARLFCVVPHAFPPSPYFVLRTADIYVWDIYPSKLPDPAFCVLDNEKDPFTLNLQKKYERAISTGGRYHYILNELGKKDLYEFAGGGAAVIAHSKEERMCFYAEPAVNYVLTTAVRDSAVPWEFLADPKEYEE